MLALMLSLAGCRGQAPSEPPAEPEPPPPDLPSYSEMMAPPPEPLDLSPDPLPEGVAAAVDGEPILDSEVEAIATLLRAAVDSQPIDEDLVRLEALRQMIEQRLLQAKADQMDVRVSEAEIDVAVDHVVTTRGITRAELEAEVADAGGDWEQYRDALVAELIRAKVLDILGVFGPGSTDAEVVQARRTRVVGCLQARAEVQVRDDGVALPDNPFTLIATIGEFRFSGDTALPEPELQDIAREAAKTRLRLCDALTSAELAVQERLLEAGYLAADVRMPWPTDLAEPVAIDVLMTPGRPHVVGKVRFDQSAVPRGKRLDVAELRKRLVGVMSEGDVAAMSVLRAADEEIGKAARQAGLVVEPDVKRKEGKTRVRLNVTYRIAVAGR